MRNRLTDNDCLVLLEALKKSRKENLRRGKWKAVYKILPRDLKSRMSMGEMRRNWYNLSCEANGKRKTKRNVGNVSRKILKKLKEYQTGVEIVHDGQSFKALTSTGATSHEMIVDRQKGVLDDVEDDSQNVAAQFDRGLAITADGFQSFLTGPQSFLKHGIPEAVEMVGLGVVSTNGGRADARNVTSDNTNSKGKSWSPSSRLFHWTSNFLLLLKDVVTKVTDKRSAAPGITQLAVCPQTSVAVKQHLQNEAALHEVDNESSNTFIKCYDVEANGLAELIGDYTLQTGRERILEKIEQEWGIARFNALIEESSKRIGSPIEAAFLPAFSRFRKSIISAVQSSIEVLAVEVIKEALMKELLKEK